MILEHKIHKGWCLCEEVNYEITSDLKAIVPYHCKYCSQANGAAFVTLLLMQASDLRIVQGEEELGKYHVHVTGVDRCFCHKCGTRLYNHMTVPGRLVLVVATLQTNEKLHPIAHCSTESKYAWHTINDEFAQFMKAPSQAELNKLLSR